MSNFSKKKLLNPEVGEVGQNKYSGMRLVNNVVKYAKSGSICPTFQFRLSFKQCKLM